MKQFRHLALLSTLSTLTSAAMAHEGHGLPGMAHWHATDVLGFVAIGAVLAAVIWFSGRK